jgi:WD40 repeat protein
LAAWSPNGERIVTAAENHDATEYALLIWNSTTGELLRAIDVPVSPHTRDSYTQDMIWVTWSIDGQSIISVNADGSIRYWNAENGELTRTFQLEGQEDPLQVVAWNATQDRLATADASYRLQVWDVSTGSLLATRLEHTGQSITFASWSPDGQHMASVTYLGSCFVGDETRIHVWNAQTGEAELSLPGDARRSVFWSADGTRIFTGIEELSHYVWDARTGEFLGEFEQTEDLWAFLGEPLDSRVIDAERIFYERNHDGVAVVGREIIEEIGEGDRSFMPRFTVLSPDQNRLAIVPHEYSPEIWIWDIATRERVAELTHHFVGFEVSVVTWLEWSPDGTQLMTTGLDGTMRVWGVP